MITRPRLRLPGHWGFDFREPLHADGVDLCDSVLEGDTFDLILDLSIAEDAFEGDELTL